MKNTFKKEYSHYEDAQTHIDILVHEESYDIDELMFLINDDYRDENPSPFKAIVTLRGQQIPKGMVEEEIWW